MLFTLESMRCAGCIPSVIDVLIMLHGSNIFVRLLGSAIGCGLHVASRIKNTLSCKPPSGRRWHILSGDASGVSVIALAIGPFETFSVN